MSVDALRRILLMDSGSEQFHYPSGRRFRFQRTRRQLRLSARVRKRSEKRTRGGRIRRFTGLSDSVWKRVRHPRRTGVRSPTAGLNRYGDARTDSRKWFVYRKEPRRYRRRRGDQRRGRPYQCRQPRELQRATSTSNRTIGTDRERDPGRRTIVVFRNPGGSSVPVSYRPGVVPNRRPVSPD